MIRINDFIDIYSSNNKLNNDLQIIINRIIKSVNFDNNKSYKYEKEKNAKTRGFN